MGRPPSWRPAYQRQRRRDLTAAVAAHPVGDREQVGRGERAILVHGPDPANVGRRPAHKADHASSKMVEPT